jgi:AmmeMemoRadiSam system protein A
MSPLGRNERALLLEIARTALRHAVEQNLRSFSPRASGSLSRPAGAFVTLRRDGELRGCIGQIEAAEPLASVVAHATVSAGLQDPRFRPITAGEIVSLEIEISVLSPLQPIRPEEIQIGKHGLVVSQGKSRGVLLPQVAVEHGLSVERFLEETCRKGGLERNAWKLPVTQIQGFTAEIFSTASELGESDSAPSVGPPSEQAKN